MLHKYSANFHCVETTKHCH